MRLQYADLIRKGSGDTQGAAVHNALNATVCYLTVTSENTPSVTVEVCADKYAEGGTWESADMFTPSGTRVTGIDANGIYFVSVREMNWIRAVSASSDDTLEVYGSFSDVPDSGGGQGGQRASDAILDSETDISDDPDGYIDWQGENEGSRIAMDENGMLVQSYPLNAEFLPALLSMNGGSLTGTGGTDDGAGPGGGERRDMRMQYAEFIAEGTGDTVSEAVRNELDANVCYLAVLSDATPSVTVEVMSDRDLSTGTWLNGTIVNAAGEEIQSITENGIYVVPLGGVQWMRVKNGSADTTLEVSGSLNAAPVAGWRKEEDEQDEEL